VIKIATFKSSKDMGSRQITKRFLSVREIAVYLGCSQAAVRKWVRIGAISFHKINGMVRFDIQQVRKWTDKNRNSIS